MALAWETLDAVPSAAGELVLRRRGASDFLITVAGRVLMTSAAKASWALAKATWQGAKYAHERGWDKKAAGIASQAASMTGSLAKTAYTSPLGKAAISTALGGSAWDTATDLAAGETIEGMAGRSRKIYVIVPPDAVPGQQIYVVSPTGESIIVEVPKGTAPGAQFLVELPVARK